MSSTSSTSCMSATTEPRSTGTLGAQSSPDCQLPSSSTPTPLWSWRYTLEVAHVLTFLLAYCLVMVALTGSRPSLGRGLVFENGTKDMALVITLMLHFGMAGMLGEKLLSSG